MYDFYFGTREEIEEDPKKYLLTIKRMLPRWCNSIPDSEYLALYDAISDFKLGKKPILMETGSGASTIVLAYFALKNGGQLFTWDINGSKLFFLRSVLNDTLMRHFDNTNLHEHWQHIAFSSISEFAGINVLKELNKKISVCFFDSEHTLEVLMKEVMSASQILEDPALLAIDDGNYSYSGWNTSYINMIRKKLDLPPIGEKPENLSRSFWIEVDEYLKKKFRKVEYLKDTYKNNYQSDIFWSYYKSDRDAMSGLSMEKNDNLEHRFDSWKIWK